jgi:hypothetical protein
LVKSMLRAVPIYHLIAHQRSKWVVKAIDKVQRPWEKVCKPVTMGGFRSA